MSKEEKKETSGKYYIDNREERMEYQKTRYAAKREEIIEKQKKYNRKRSAENPWEKHYYNARQRCANPNDKKFRWYGGRGIRFLLSMYEVKNLFERDDAWSLKKPSIDRIYNNGDYVFGNCRFIEMAENVGRNKRI